MKILNAESGDGSLSVRLGFKRQNLWQLCYHFLLAVCIGVSLRLTTFTEATTIASTLGDEYKIKTSFLVAFGFTKACSNLIVGRASDIYGRKTPHALGWVFGILLGIVLLLLCKATNENTSGQPGSRWMQWYVLANICLGAQQGMTWTTNIFMFIDILGPNHRALSSSISNSVGYLSSAATTYAAASLSAESAFRAVLGTALLGWVVGTFMIKDTTSFVEQEMHQVTYTSAATTGVSSEWSDEPVTPEESVENQRIDDPEPVHDRTSFELDSEGLSTSIEVNVSDMTSPFLEVLTTTCWRNPSAAILCAGGLMANLNTSLAWGLVLIWGKEQGLSALALANIGSAFTFAKGIVMVLSGYISDRQQDRKHVLMGGFFVAIIGLGITATADLVRDTDAIYLSLLLGGIVIGTGIGSVYCVMTAALSDHTPPQDRASAIGVYKFWRDSGYAFGGLLTGWIADASGGSFVFPTMVVAALTGFLVIGFYFFYREVSNPSGRPCT